MYCVLGHPVAHSRSPAMQNAALAAMGLEGVYVAFDVAPEGLETAVRGLQALGIGGVNYTIPHKEAVLSLVDELDDEARVVGAVNTLVFRDARIHGHNTDGYGFLADLRAHGVAAEGLRALVLGAGGASRAVVAALARCCSEVALTNRNRERAATLASEMESKLGAQRSAALKVCGWSADEVAKAMAVADVIINTTSLGMHPHENEMPPTPANAFHHGHFVYDLIYNPLETRLLQTARQAGARTANGVGMLAHQGARALELWTGQAAPATLMQQTILESLSP